MEKFHTQNLFKKWHQSHQAKSIEFWRKLEYFIYELLVIEIDIYCDFPICEQLELNYW